MQSTTTLPSLHGNPNIPAAMTEDEVAQALMAATVRTAYELGLSPESMARAVRRSAVVGDQDMDKDLRNAATLKAWLDQKRMFGV